MKHQHFQSICLRYSLRYKYNFLQGYETSGTLVRVLKYYSTNNTLLVLKNN